MTNDSGRVLPAVTVIATMAPDRSFLQSVTDSAGRYEIHFERGTGDYLIYAGPVGYRAFRRRVALPRDTATLVLDIRLTADATLARGRQGERNEAASNGRRVVHP